MGAPLDEDGDIPAGARSCRKFSQMRVSQDSDPDDALLPRNGAPMDAPPRSLNLPASKSSAHQGVSLVKTGDWGFRGSATEASWRVRSVRRAVGCLGCDAV